VMFSRNRLARERLFPKPCSVYQLRLKNGLELSRNLVRILPALGDLYRQMQRYGFTYRRKKS